MIRRATDSPADSPSPNASGNPDHNTDEQREERDDGTAVEQRIAPRQPLSASGILPSTSAQKPYAPGGKRSRARDSAQSRGYAVGAAPPTGRPLRDVSIVGTLRAAALRRARGSNGPKHAGRGGTVSVAVQARDVRVRVRRAPTGNLVVFVVDASGSMGARKRMRLVKEAVLGLLLDAYQGRDRVSLIAFRGGGAELLVPPTNSVDVAERQLRTLPPGGRTPLAAALQATLSLLHQQQRRGSELEPLVVLVTDGRHNQGPAPAGAARRLAAMDVPIVVLDSENGFVRLGQARQLAELLNAQLLPLDVLAGGGVRSTLGREARAVRGTKQKESVPQSV